jgi:hypothetical protein
MEDPTVLPRPSEPVSPRLYALKALGLQLERIITYHENIQEAFRQSYKVYVSFLLTTNVCPLTPYYQDATVQTDLTGEPGSREDKDWMFSYSNSLERAALSNSKLIRNIEGFLGKDLMVDSDDVPRGPLWRSISTDSSATESLRKIRLSLGRLQDMKIHMDGLIYSMQKVGNITTGSNIFICLRLIRVSDIPKSQFAKLTADPRAQSRTDYYSSICK